MAVAAGLGSTDLEWLEGGETVERPDRGWRAGPQASEEGGASRRRCGRTRDRGRGKGSWTAEVSCTAWNKVAER
jgi:hypothetical protein